ncbi:MAG: S8 family serine peptidase [Acidobacteriota bacterium]|nr:MAG: S8 family serine peptidase [Acidobacteriota bacterium]
MLCRQLRPMRLALFVLTSLLFGPVVLASAGTGAAFGPPTLEIETGERATKVWVELTVPHAGLARVLLRETTALVQRGPTGRDPSAQASFATWDELAGDLGSGARARRWFAFSRDGGASWSEARPLERALELRDAEVLPGESMPTPALGLALPRAGKLWLVQFRTIGLPEWRAALVELGAELFQFVPHHAHIVRLDPSRVSLVRALDFVERIEPYHAGYRIGPPLRAWLDEQQLLSAPTQRVRVVALEWGETGKERIAAAAKDLGAEIVENWPNGHIIELNVTREQLRVIAGHDDVLWIDLWSAPENDMDLVREDAGTNWLEDNFGYCGQGVRGEVLDSGIEETHKDFDGLILHGGNSTSSHGTSTFGIVFGNGNRDGDGEAKGTGHMPCPEAQGIFADYDFLGDRFAHTEELKNDPYFASFQTNSWGAARTLSYTSVSHEMDDIIWRLDIAITQSQSNAGNQDSRPQAWAKNIISVGGIKHKDTLTTSDDEWDFGASIGPAEDGRIKPDINYWYDNIYTTTTGDSYTSSFGGTSAATPESAGVLGLMVQMWADNVWETDPEGTTVFEKQPHFSTIKALLINNAQQYDFVGESDDLTRVHQGWGRPSARLAKERAASSFIIDEEVILELSDFSIYDVDVAAGESELKVTMVYPDPPGTTSAAMHRINDLNLKVTSPSGTIYHGNHGLLEGKYSTPGGEPNGLDTVENVFISNPEAGIWKVEIEAAEINQDAYLDTPDDDATFALVVTGGTSQLIQPSAGRVRLDRDFYSCDHRVGIRVIDGNVGAGSMTVEVWSDSETERETVTLTETKPGSGKYAGEIYTTGTPPAAGDGLVSVVHDDAIIVEYIDADDGEGGLNVIQQDQASADCQKPLITGVGERDLSDVSGTIVWTTDELADSEVVWGETIPPTQSEVGFGRTIDHAITLTGLTECTIYYYEVHSADVLGNAAIDDNGGSYYHFETLGDFGDGLQPCHAGQVTIDEPVYSCTDSVTFRVVDLDLNLDPEALDSVTLWVSSSSEPDPEPIVATETDVNSATFTGAITTSAGVPAPDGTLQTADGDTITVTYRDEDDGTGTPRVSFATAAADCAGPVISELGTTAITDARLTVTWKTQEPADTVLEWGTTPALGETISSSGLVTDHSVLVNQLEMCSELFVRARSTDQHGNSAVADLGGSPLGAFTWDIPGLYWRDNFENGAGSWTLEGEWEVGVPQGLGGSTGLSDPLEAYNNQHVLGHDLSGQGSFGGDYEPNTTQRATTPDFDATSWTNTKLIYYRRLNTHSSDEASLWLFAGPGRPLFRSEGTISNSSFIQESADLAGLVDGQPVVRLQFQQQADGSVQYSGWNIDDLILKDGSLPDYAACGGCLETPTFAGVVSARDNDACGETGVTVSWNETFSWGSGASGSFALYRDTSPGFTPSAANLVTAGIAGLSHVDESAPLDVPVYYLVRAETDETCSTGPNNGGLTDDNSVYVPVTDTNDQPIPGAVTDLAVSLVNRAHVRLSWSAPADAAEYHAYRSEEPQPESFQLLGDTKTTQFDDEASGANEVSYFYLVNAANACGQEGP